ncbi:hypothetical protein PS663_05788 [Pseudomonas fluorescens]|nr:hypothetical protein PS663_05788 [Pseudomonas fluorescens]
MSLAVAEQHITALITKGKHATAIEVGTVAQLTETTARAKTSAKFLTVLEELAGLQRLERGYPAEYGRPALPRLAALVDLDAGEELRVDHHGAVALLVAVDVEVLPHAVDVHVHAAVILHATNVHRQTGVTLVDGGVDARGFFKHVGSVTRRAFVDHVTADDGHGLWGLVHPIARLAICVARDGGGAYGHGAGVVVADTTEGDLALTGKPILHRRGTEQTAQALLHAETALDRGAAQPLQALAVEQHLQASLVGEGQHGTAKRLRGNIERQHSRLGSTRLRLRGIHRRDSSEHAQVNGQG